MRTRTLTTSLGIGVASFVLLLVRGWRGLDHIPSDPGYEYIAGRVANGVRAFEVVPYLHADQPLIASFTSLLPLVWHGISTTLLSHLVWSLCAVAISLALSNLGVSRLTSALGGALLVLTPWASQSAIGNFGNVRWPILVMATVVIVSESTQVQPRLRMMLLAGIAVTFSNPLHVLLLLPLAYAALHASGAKRKILAVAALPLVAGTTTNVLNAATSGHDTKIERFWSGASLFWTSGQLLPAAVAALFIAASVVGFRRLSQQRIVALHLFAMAIIIAAASYQLGGIADRYFVAPAALTAVGGLLFVNDFRSRSPKKGMLLAIALAILLLVPAARWFFVLPWLRSAPAWSEQVQQAKQRCDENPASEFTLITSDGQGATHPIPCDRS
ncbi:MAG: hypothetical protein ACKPCO_10390 [Actinomycetota bacterium]